MDTTRYKQALALYYGVTVAAMTLGALALSLVASRVVATVGVALLMWTPALGRLVATRVLDRAWKTTAPLRWPRRALRSVLFPFGVELGIYGSAWALGLALGLAAWAPRWAPDRLALNLALNTAIGVVIGGFGALGEELGWRGYMQPRLQSAGVAFASVWVGLLWWAFHLPVVFALGYQESSHPVLTQAMFAVAGVADSYLWMWACTREQSVWPAVWFHAFHNVAGQGLFPSLMKADAIWLGEDGVLTVGAHVLAGIALWLCARDRDGPRAEASP